MGFVTQYGPLVGRILIALIFVLAGFAKLVGFSGAVGYIASAGLPFPEVLAALTIAVELGGGLMIMLGWKARLAALAIFLWLIPVTIVYHNMFTNPGEAIQFQKNLCIMGAMLYVMAFGSGRYSLRRD